MNEWSSSTRYFVLTALLLGLSLFVYVSRAIIGSLVIACLLAFLINPLVTQFRIRMRVQHSYAVVIVYTLLLFLLVGLFIYFVPIFIKQAENLSQEIQMIWTQLETYFAQPRLVFGVRLPLYQFSIAIRETVSQLFQPERVFRVITSVMTNFVWVLMVLVVTYYLLLDGEHLREWFMDLSPEVYKNDVRRIQGEIIAVWRKYFRGQLLVMLLVGILSGLSGALVGLPKAAILGIMTGMLDLIPSFGPITATMLAAVVARHQGSAVLPISNSWFTIIVIVIFMCIQAIENIWIQPRIMGKILRKHPGLIFVAVTGALTIGSALLALIIVPVLGSVSVISRYLHRRLLGLEPWPEMICSHPQDTQSGLPSHSIDLNCVYK